VYLRLDRDVRQPFRKAIDLDQQPADIRAEAGRLEGDGAPPFQPAG